MASGSSAFALDSDIPNLSATISFRARLRWLRKYVSLMNDATLADLFVTYWCKKCSCWDCGCGSCVKNERKVTVLLNVCWAELTRRGWSQLHVVDGRLLGKRVAGDVQLAV